jgi:hypothetical protein
VINGFSDLILDVFGPEVGAHARSAVGTRSALSELIAASSTRLGAADLAAPNTQKEQPGAEARAAAIAQTTLTTCIYDASASPSMHSITVEGAGGTTLDQVLAATEVGGAAVRPASDTDATDSSTLLRVGIDGAGPRLPSTFDSVNAVAQKYGIDTSGIPFKINDIVYGAGGETFEDASVALYHDAFANEETLARTIYHETLHVGDLRGGVPFADSTEEDAYIDEYLWWVNHPLNAGGR